MEWSPQPDATAQFQERGADNWIEAVGGDRGKPKRNVQRLRLSHELKRIEKHPPVAATPALGDDAFRERAPDATTPTRRNDVEPFHLARVVGKLPERNATEDLRVIRREEKASVGRAAFPGEIAHLTFEVLEAHNNFQTGRRAISGHLRP